MPDTDSKDSPGDVNLETHPLVAKLHADPDEFTDLVALVGYLGPSKKADYVRLYVDLTFRNYYEIPTEGIVSTSPTAAADENSPTTVHVAGGTQVDKVSITSQSTEARFLQGSIASGYLGGAGVGAGADAACSWPQSPTCWCVTAHNCQQGAAQAAQPYTDTVYASCACSYGQNTCNTCAPVCGQAGAQANVQAWPPSPSCYGTCWHQQTCGQAGAQANAEPWPASPTCWCNITRNCNQQAAAPGQVGAWPVTGACHYTQWRACGQGGAQANPEYWTMGATCTCATWIQCNTSQGCT